MRKDRRSKIKKERMIMLASSALVMGALTLTGIYMKGQSDEQIDDGYSVDFSALEDSVDDKIQEIAQNNQSDILEQADDSLGAQAGLWAENETGIELANNGAGDTAGTELAGISGLEDDLDYDPLAAGSNVIEIPGLTDGTTAEIAEETKLDGLDSLENSESDDQGTKKETDKKTDKTTESTKTSAEAVTKELSFTESQGLVRPASGEILMHYSMDKSIYFSTLDQYKYNPAVMISATEGDTVTVCADGKVVSIFDYEEIGHAVVLDLGNGYQATYGQLQNVQVEEGAYVNRGEALGTVAAPTKYFTVEGTNLYFALTKDGTSVNPEGLFQ